MKTKMGGGFPRRKRGVLFYHNDRRLVAIYIACFNAVPSCMMFARTVSCSISFIRLIKWFSEDGVAIVRVKVCVVLALADSSPIFLCKIIS